MMNHKHTMIFHSFVDEEILDLRLDEMIDWCYYVKENDPGRVVSNSGGWQSHDLDLKIPEIFWLVSKIFEKGEKLLETYQITGKFYIDPLWININGYRDFNMYHEHPRSLFSGVFYLKCPNDCGDLVMVHPMVQHQHYINPSTIKNFNEFNSYIWPTKPEENKLCVERVWYGKWPAASGVFIVVW